MGNNSTFFNLFTSPPTRACEETRDCAFFVRWETITRVDEEEDPVHTAFMRSIFRKVGPVAAERHRTDEGSVALLRQRPAMHVVGRPRQPT